jgi:hypothetical protein
MKIEQRNVRVHELVAGFKDNGEGGVVGLNGELDIRPPYQREFVYRDKQRNSVIETVRRGFPLNVMYFADRGDGTYEVMDGQQRTISICQYVNNEFGLDYKYFHNLTQDEQDSILYYELIVYFCSGTDSEKLDWFRTINIAGERLYEQELRNAVYHGVWLTDAKRWFSRSGGPAAQVGDNYVTGSPIRQELLAMALEWACLRDGLTAVDEYMALHQHDPNATDLWSHYQRVLEWAKSTFPVVRKELKSVDWGSLYHQHGSSFPDGKVMEQRVAELMADEDVTRKSGIYQYVLDGQEKHLSIRAFSSSQKREAYEEQKGICPACGKHFELSGMEADHIQPWSLGGRTIPVNCRMLCKEDNRRKSNI